MSKETVSKQEKYEEMFFIPETGLQANTYKDNKGRFYIHLPKHGKRRFYLA